ncbi:unnamed protein product [Camellia sinensis]
MEKENCVGIEATNCHLKCNENTSNCISSLLAAPVLGGVLVGSPSTVGEEKEESTKCLEFHTENSSFYLEPLLLSSDLPIIARTAGKLAGRAIGYVQLARGQFDTIMHQTQARQNYSSTNSGFSDMHSQATAYAKLAESTAINSESVESNEVINELTDESGIMVLPVSAKSTGLLPDRKDLKTMSKRVESEQYYYVTFEMFVADVKRMFGNARTYNSPETIYYKCASRHGWKPISLAKFNRVFNLASKSSIDKFQLVEHNLPINRGEKLEKFSGIDFKRWQQKMLLMATETNAQTSTIVVAAIAPTPSPVMTVPINRGEKLEKFSGIDFKRWQQKMLFYLTTLNLARFLREDAPILKEDETDRQVVAAVDAWKHADFLCRNYFKNYLKHKRKEISMDELIVRLRIEEDNRNSEKRVGKHLMESKANVAEHASKTKKRKSFGESSSQGSKGGNNKNSTIVVAAIAPTPSPVMTVPINRGEKLEKFSGIDFKRWQQKMLLMATETNAQTSTIVVAAIAPTPSPVMTVPINRGEKLEKFSGIDFKRWQQKMLFYLTTLNLARFLREDAPILKEDETDRQVVAAVDAWKHADFLCRNYVLNGLDNTLYNVYKDISLSESFQVAVLIEKFPKDWKEFKNYLKHKRKEISMDELIVRLRIEEDNRNSEKRVGKHLMESKANVAEHASKTKKRKSFGESSSQGSKGGNNKKYKFNGKCYICPETIYYKCASRT